MRFSIASLVALGASTPLVSSAILANLRWDLLPTNITQQFRGLSPVSDQTAWVAGTAGTVLRTLDGGKSWANVSPPNVTDLEFRDVQAFSATNAVILAIGEGNSSRIYLTSDGGISWAQAFENAEETAFYDCMAFENAQHGIAMSDPVDGRFRLLETLDGGATWAYIDPAGIPAALPGEAGFAASGTCIATAAGRWYLASGGVDPGRIYRSVDGHQWEVSPSAIRGSSEGAGVFSVAFRDARHGIAVGGDYTKPNTTDRISAWSSDGGISWQASDVYPGGYRSGSSWMPGFCGAALAVGTTGSDVTTDGGKTWRTFDNGTFDAVECILGGICWASGSKGRVARLVMG